MPSTKIHGSYRSVLRLIITLCVGSLSISHPAHAGFEVMDWTACVNEARANNPVFNATRHAVDQAGFAIKSSQGTFFPQISSTLTANRAASDMVSRNTGSLLGTGGNTTNTNPNGGDWTIGNQFSLDITIKQSLMFGLKDRPLVHKREAEQEASLAARDKAAADLAYDLKAAFVSHIYSQELIDLTRSVRERRRENVRLVELRFESGRENKGSVLKAQSSLAAAELDSMSAERALGVARTQLSRALGRQTVADTVVKGELSPPHKPAQLNLFDLSQTLPNVRQAAATAKAAALDVTSARAATYPDVSAQASTSRSGSTWAPDDKRVAIGLVVSIPLFTGGRQTADIHAAAEGQARADANLQGVRLQAVTDLTAAHAALLDAIGRLDVQKKLIEAAQLQAEISRNQYAIGLLTFQEWDIFENALIEARKAMLNAKKDAAVAEAQWKRALGLPLKEEPTS